MTLAPADTQAVGTGWIAVQTAAGVRSMAVPFAVFPPSVSAPSVTSLSPASKAAGSQTFFLRIVGAGFTPNAKGLWNSSSRPTIFIDDRTLSVMISFEDVAKAGEAGVQVETPAGRSNILRYPVSGGTLRPRLSGLDPAELSAGSPAVTLTLNGVDFGNSAVLLWNGSPRPTRFVDARRLVVDIPASDLASPGAALLAVRDMSGTSGTLRVVIAEAAAGQGGPETVTDPLALGPADDYSQAMVYPNPWLSRDHAGRRIAFARLTASSRIRLFTLSARWIKTLDAPNGSAQWDLTNDAGQAVASGYYLYVIEDPTGRRHRGKLAVLR
jgi:hypothetical protein